MEIYKKRRNTLLIGMLVAISAICYALLISTSKLTMGVHSLSGVFLVIIMFVGKNEYVHRSPVIRAISCILTLIILFSDYGKRLVSSFGKLCEHREESLKIIEYIFPNNLNRFNSIGFFLICFSCPFIYISILNLIEFFVCVFKGISIKKILVELKNEIEIANLARIIANMLIAVLIGIFLLYLVFLIPNDYLELNAEESAKMIQKEGYYPNIKKWTTGQLDNWSDGLMLNLSTDRSKDTTYNRIMYMYRGSIDGASCSSESFVIHYLQGKKYDGEKPYHRYWHGYLVFLKPLLVFFDYEQIRIINGFVQLLMIILLGYMLKKNGYERFIIPLLFGYIMVEPITIMKSMLFSIAFYICVLSSLFIVLMKKNIKNNDYNFFFLNIGIVTGFFDLLTYPVLSFCIPVIFSVIVDSEEDKEKQMCNVIRKGIYWVAGYLGIWSMKWIVATMTTSENVLKNALKEVEYRTSNSLPGDDTISAITCIMRNINSFFETPYFLLFLIWIVILLCRIKKMDSKIEVSNSISSIALVSIFPLLWYVITINHSTVHYWFACRNCLVFIYLFGLWIVEHIDMINSNKVCSTTIN